MSGVKRRSGYRKNVTDEVLYGTPEPKDGQLVAQVSKSFGSNLLQVETAEGETGLALLPTRFRKLVWIKRGDYLIVTGADGEIETSAGGEGKVRFIIDSVLYSDQVKHLKAAGLWPERFAGSTSGAAGAGAGAGPSSGAGRGLPPADDDDDEDGDDKDGERGAGKGAGAANDDSSEDEEDDSDDEEEEEDGGRRRFRRGGQGQGQGQGRGQGGGGAGAKGGRPAFGRPGELPPSRSESEDEDDDEEKGSAEGGGK
jgi:probable RNA-binding protein EIF1AD